MRVAVFVDSAWWHGHPSRWQPGRHPPEWDQKILRNRERDDQVNQTLSADGWEVVRVWDFELDGDSDECVMRVRSAVSAARSQGGAKEGLRADRARVEVYGPTHRTEKEQ